MNFLKFASADSENAVLGTNMVQKALSTSLSRRQMIFVTAWAGSALLIGCSGSGAEKSAATAKAGTPPPPPAPFDAYISIATDGQVTVYSSQFEMGQGVYHALATLVAEELEVPLSQVRVEGRAGNPAFYGNIAMGGQFQLTGGSSSIPSSYERYRNAGAIARTQLLGAAAQLWSLPLSELSASEGMVRHAASNQAIAYQELLASAAKLPVPDKVVLKTPEQWRLLGKEGLPRIDAKAKSRGQQNYTIDLQLPNMLVASIKHSPRFGGKVRSFDATAAKAVMGVVEVVQISNGVAVVAKDTWAALQGVEALQVTWDDSGAEKRSSREMLAEFETLSADRGLSSVAKGDAAKQLESADTTLEAVFRFPFLAHAALEPLNAAVAMETAADGSKLLHIYGGLQMPDVVQGTCAKLAGVEPSAVRLHVQQSGGGFGRRAVPDCDVFVEAVEIAKALDFRVPIKLQWSRSSDMTGGRYRPAHVHRVKVGLKDGAVSAWQHHIVGLSILSGTPFESMMVKDGIDNSMTEGVSNTPYQFANFAVDVTHPKSPVTVLWWRSVGHTHTAYVMETMIDEVAEKLQLDPVTLRLNLLPAEARERAVLQLAVDKAGKPKTGRYQGVAVHSSFGSFVATVVELSKSSTGEIKVERCVLASDCGIVLNPDNVRSQLEGGTGFGLGSVLSEQLTLEAGAALEQNYDSYRVLRMDQMPTIEIHVLASSAAPTGIGECAVPPVGPAFANALYRATGQRLRDLPWQKS